MRIVELRFDGSHTLKQVTIHQNTDAVSVAAHEYPNKPLKPAQSASMSIRPGTSIPRAFRVEDATATGMFGMMAVSEYSLLVEVP